ncbi:hypothetical protein Pa4123_42430 [Phytohabitans aurantiacus]|uniref:Uncharacterized protein n=1 Tax=Phytohabitans aurantiacus TaxID=3016789 RepID=A0ABQ5QWN4_9ACTN|nr:hypothetical protein Pa4123_42430 [Phytohabitans aurantiacus]
MGRPISSQPAVNRTAQTSMAINRRRRSASVGGGVSGGGAPGAGVIVTDIGVQVRRRGMAG